jgi:hypothetical protein
MTEKELETLCTSIGKFTKEHVAKELAPLRASMDKAAFSESVKQRNQSTLLRKMAETIEAMSKRIVALEAKQRD